MPFAIEYHKNNKQTKEAPISTLVCPEVIADDTNKYAAYSEFDTIIQIDLKETVLKEVINQIEEDIDSEVLIFLNHLECIELNNNGVIIKYIKEKLPDSRVKLTTIENGNAQPARFWNINTLSGRFEDIDKDYQLSVAWKDELDEKKDVIYSYFRTKVPFLFSGILHGTFDLNGDRNDISSKEGYNIKLIGLIPDLIANTAKIIADKETEVNYRALGFTIFKNNNLPKIIRDSEFENKLKDALQAKKIYPTICNKYISFKDEPQYYKQDVFAKLLPKDDFPDILICCEDEDIKKDLSKLKNTKTPKYSFQSLCSAISAKSKDYSREEYASLIKALIDFVDLDKEEDKSKLCLFFDSEFNPLSFNNSIFLPSNETTDKLPSEIGVQIIHPELAEELKKILDANSYQLLLSKFKIKIFDFKAIVELLINHYNYKEAKNEGIIKLNQTIYKLYQNEKPEKIWDGLAVPLITKNKNIELANKLYFGTEYGCSITEAIYKYNTNKLVNSIKEYGIDGSDSVNWKSYLKWLGVAELPRKIQASSNIEFAKYAMKYYDFKNKIENYNFHSFSKFNEACNRYGIIEIQTIDEIDNILSSNNNEVILAWLNSDSSLVDFLEKDYEPDKSIIEVHFIGDHSNKKITGKRIKNFIKWKLSTTHWLSTKSGKQPPNLCTTSNTITDEFSPLINKPNINFDAEIFISNDIKPPKVKSLLYLVGVNETISSFETNTLYSILSKLPKIDPKGKKARTLYNEIAKNYDVNNLDKSDAKYQLFSSEGKVYCKKKNDGYGYENTNTVFYVDNKRYGKSVINQFFTIEVDPGKGTKKIEEIFGVKPLEKLELNLCNEPILHTLNDKFEREIEAFKPYVYVFRHDLDTKGKEKNQIKDVKFKLVTELKVLLGQENKKMELYLSDYEYLIKSENVFIKTPGHLNDEKKLKEDFNFCVTIAEAFSDLINENPDKHPIRELFSYSLSQRDDLIRALLDDKNLEKLILAGKNLGIVNDPKIQFWNAFIKCFPTKNIKKEEVTDEELLEELKRLFPETSEQIVKIFDEIDYNNYNEGQSLRLIIELLNKTGLSLENVNKYAYPSIDISELYELDLKGIKDQKKNKFKAALYASFINSEKDKMGFLEDIDKYDSFIGNFQRNVIDYNIEDDLCKQVQKEFQLDILNVEHDFNLEEIYSTNKTKYELRAEQEQISKEIANQFITENRNFESLLYFENELENLMISLIGWAQKSSDGSPSGKGLGTKIFSVGDSAFSFNDYSDLRLQLENHFGNGEGRFKINLSKIKIKRIEPKNSPSGGPNPPIIIKRFKQPKKSKEVLGFFGEWWVYKTLFETVKNKESIKWVSKNAKLAGVNLDGNDGEGYDLRYIPNGADKVRCVEVKVVGSENAFHITSNEIKQGEKLKKYYEIFLVRNILDIENISIQIIQGPFDYKVKDKIKESFNDNELFTVINDTFILKFEKMDEK